MKTEIDRELYEKLRDMKLGLNLSIDIKYYVDSEPPEPEEEEKPKKRKRKKSRILRSPLTLFRLADQGVGYRLRTQEQRKVFDEVIEIFKDSNRETMTSREIGWELAKRRGIAYHRASYFVGVLWKYRALIKTGDAPEGE